jgi:O-antigen/teichoic acid export membrane protein
MTAVLVPSISAALAAQDRERARSYLSGAMRFMIIALVPGCALIAINAAEVLSLLFSSDYAGGAGLLVVLVFAYGLFYTMFMSLANALIGAGRAATSARLSLAALVLAVALSVTLVRWAGAPGAAFAALIANAAAVTGAGIAIARTVGMPVDGTVLARVLLLTVVICVPSWWIEAKGAMLLLELAIVAIAYLALLPIAGLLEWADLEAFLPRWAKRATKVV